MTTPTPSSATTPERASEAHPLPWSFDWNDSCWTVWDSNGLPVFITSSSRAVAESAVRAVNNHVAMLAENERIRSALERVASDLSSVIYELNYQQTAEGYGELMSVLADALNRACAALAQVSKQRPCDNCGVYPAESGVTLCEYCWPPDAGIPSDTELRIRLDMVRAMNAPPQEVRHD